MHQSLEHPPRRSRDSQALMVLERLLLSDDLAAAFNSFGPGAPVSMNRGLIRPAPVMSLNSQLKAAYASLKETAAVRNWGAQTKPIVAAALAFALLFSPVPPDTPFMPTPLVVQARDMAGAGSGSPVTKDPDALLRFALPNQPKEMTPILSGLETSRYNIGKRNWLNVVGAVNSAKKGLDQKSTANILKAVPKASAPEAEKLLANVKGDVEALGKSALDQDLAVSTQKAESALDSMGEIGRLIASDYKQPAPPAEYNKLPYLKGRATVDLTLKRPGGKFDVYGTLYDQIDLTLTVDGYTAPITAGNFVDLVDRGFFNGFPIQRSDGFVIQTGDPTQDGVPAAFKSKQTGFVPPGKTKARRIPLEVMISGDKQPFYEATYDDDGRGGQPAVLPFNSYGALGMARSEDDLKSASTQFFWLLFDSDLTPAGKNVLDGYYSCFGMTTKNANLLADVKEGDMVTSAKVTTGLENLVKPPDA